ncbi:MAG: nuclear transport factor 2 family protein [Pyrinomonadaceae bacterium]
MRRILFVLTTCIMASLLLISCGDPGAGNNGNKPANSANNAAATAPVNTAALETDLKKLTTDMAASLVKNDIPAMEKVYGENYVFVGPDGSVATRAQRVEAMKTGDTKYESITYDDISVRTNPEGTGAIVISKATVRGKNMGKDVNGLYRVTHVWSKTKDGWRMANGQTTPITGAAEPAKADDKKAEGDKPAAANTAPANK